MIGFAEVYTALNSGKKVRRKRWDKGSVMFAHNGTLMYSSRGREARTASSDHLDWRDMTANDWEIL